MRALPSPIIPFPCISPRMHVCTFIHAGHIHPLSYKLSLCYLFKLICTPPYTARARSLELATTTTVASPVFVQKPVPENFVSASSHVVLMGEAAHPMLVSLLFSSQLLTLSGPTLRSIVHLARLAPWHRPHPRKTRITLSAVFSYPAALTHPALPPHSI